jgi:4-amino-4-deoxy-L-arabinose transferase-like glycosyltransferase
MPMVSVGPRQELDKALPPIVAREARGDAVAARGRRVGIAIAGALAVYALVVRLVVAFQLPPWQGPDEPKHFEYIRTLIDLRQQLWTEHRLLEISDASVPFEREVIASMGRYHFWGYVAQPTPETLPVSFEDMWKGAGTQLHRPSLFYFAGAAVVAPIGQAPIEEQLLAVRVLSAVLGGLTVIVAYAAGRAAWPRDRFVATVAAAFVAALPMNVFLGGNANVDNLATLVGGVVAWGLARGIMAGFHRLEWCLVLGGFALGLATKREFLGVLPGIALAGLVWAVQQRHALTSWMNRRVLIACAGGIVLIGLVAVWSGIVGRLTTSVSAYALNEPNQVDRLLHPPMSPGEVLALIGLQWGYFFTSFWGTFGWFTTPLSQGIYPILSVASGLCALGLIVALSTNRGPDAKRLITLVGVYGLMILTMTVLAFGVPLSYFSPNQVPQGRQIFGVLVPIAILFAIGARVWLPSRRLGTWLPAVVVLVLLVLLDVSAYSDSFAPSFVTRVFSS